MAARDIPTIFAELVTHPLRELPYSKIRFARIDGNGTLLYAVEQRDGTLSRPFAARKALFEAADHWGARCFYHQEVATCPDNPDGQLNVKRQRDHVLAVSCQGEDHLHNLVLCCEHANSRKSATSICAFAPDRAAAYLKAWSLHISAAIGPPVRTI